MKRRPTTSEMAALDAKELKSRPITLGLLIALGTGGVWIGSKVSAIEDRARLIARQAIEKHDESARAHSHLMNVVGELRTLAARNERTSEALRSVLAEQKQVCDLARRYARRRGR